MISLLNVARPIAMKALQNPKILGSLLVGSVGAQQANEIQNQLSLGNISLDDVYDTLINFASSPAVSIIDEMQTTPSGEVYAPDQEQIDAERKFNEELNKNITLPSETPLDQILSTPETTTKPEPLITPDVPKQKTKVEDVGFTAAPDVKPSDYIMTAEEKKTDVTPKIVYSPQDSILKNEIRPVLSTDLLNPQYLKKLKKDDDISCGQCYAASEAAFHMYGKENGFKSYVLNSKTFPEELDKGETHWFLKNKEGEIIDPTAEQFGDTTIPYDKGRGTGFLTKNPSKASQQIIDRVNQNNAQILSGTEFVSNAAKLKDTKVKIPDVLEYLDSGKKRDIFNEEDYKEMLDEGLQEINYQLQQEVTGEGWYDEGVKKAMDIAPKINPKFADNPDLKDLLLFTTAIASSGVNVGSDFKVGLQVADIFADTGQIPLTNPKTGSGWTVRGSNLAKQLNLANNYIQKNGLPAFLEFMHSEVQGRDIQDFRKEYGNLGPSKGVRMEEYYSGHRAFGPKIGEFMANLYGVDDNNVTDMWNIRGMNRLMGGSMYVRDKDGKILSNKDGTVMENTGSPTKEFKIVFDKYMTDLSNLIGKSVRDTQAIRWYLEQGLYTALGVRSVPKDYGTAAQEVLDQKLKTESDGTIRSSKTSNIKGTPPTKKAQGGSISIPQRRSLVNDGLVDINTIIGKINYGN
jgi:hypothetical protein